METDAPAFTTDKKGAQSLLETLRPRIDSMWRSDRDTLKTDDLVAIIDMQSSEKRMGVRLETRSSVYRRLKKHHPEYFALEHIINPAPAKPGIVSIWAIIGFPTGQTCILPMVLARS